jgi:hypothetical protein
MTNTATELNAIAEGLVVRSLRFHGVRKDVRPHTRDYAQTRSERINQLYVRCASRMSTLRAEIARNVLVDGRVSNERATWKKALQVAIYRTKCANLEQQANALMF